MEIAKLMNTNLSKKKKCFHIVCEVAVKADCEFLETSG